MSSFRKVIRTIRESVERYADVKALKPVVREDQIYNYIQDRHHTPDDFVDGDISDRIEEFQEYHLKEVSLDDIDIDEFFVDESAVEDFMDHYASGSPFPPIVLADDYRIIDGTHRANAADRLGHKTIKAYIGVK